MTDITRILSAGNVGDPSAADALLPLVYAELRCLARQRLSQERPGQTLDATGLVHEAYLRLMPPDGSPEHRQRWENRAHFFAATTTAMRHALIDHARHRKAKGRNAIVYFSPDEILFHDLAAEANDRPERIILLEEALALIEAGDKRLSDLIDQFYFGGYSIPEMAHFAGVSEKTIDRDLKKARTVLKKMVEKLSLAT